MDDAFERQKRLDIQALGADAELQRAGLELVIRSAPLHYSYNFTWLGLPVIQMPQDLLALQELVWRVRPGAIVETGVARGGSLAFHASLLELLGGDRLVVGVDVDIRPANRRALERHALYPRMRLVEGSSAAGETFAEVQRLVGERTPVLVVLDSNHTHEHVLEELRMYSGLVGPGSYLVVFDTVVEQMPEGAFPERPWGRGNNPWTAVQQFLRENSRFEPDRAVDGKLLLTTARGGYLRCVRA